MSVYHARDLALKLFGLYFLIRFAELLPALFWGMSASISGPGGGGQAIVLMMLSQGLVFALYLIVGYSFTFRTRQVTAYLWREAQVDEAQDPAPSAQSLSFWLKLLGVYFGVRAASSLASCAVGVVAEHGLDLSSRTTQEALGQGVMLVIAWFCIWKTQRVVEILSTSRELSQ